MQRRTPPPSVFRRAALAVAIAFGCAGSMLAPCTASAAAPMVKTQAPGYYRMMLGNFEITALSDGTVVLPVDTLLHEPKAKTDAALKKAFAAAPLETSVNAFLINTGDRLVLVDAGAGALFGPTLGKLLANLQAAGYQPEQVDDILITHMHPDHVGGLVADGKPVFPNAVVHADQRDADFWLSPQNLDKAATDAKGYFQGAMASLNPYVAAGRFKPFGKDGEVVPGVASRASYGHTAGHTSYVVESQGHTLVLIGDLIHVAAVQFDAPAVTIGFDSDPKAAAQARQRVFAQAAKEGDWVAAAHLQFPGLGHLRAAGKSWQWVPANYTTSLK
jgi:glyoxylase-like metal-dependent hydrolase (beta-lactamase superfamily II)